jgi:phosphoadenosine phosphosulfate reductase
LPAAARDGEGVTRRTPALAWYDGPTVLQVLDGFAPAKPLAAVPVRMPVQAVYKFDNRRIIAGRIESGQLAVGDDVVVAPAGTPVRIRSIETWPPPADGQWPQTAAAGQSIGLTLEQPVVIDRGDLLAAAGEPAVAARRLRARIFWLHDEPLRAGTPVGVRVGSADRRGTIDIVEKVFDPGELTADRNRELGRNHIGEIEIVLDHPIAADLYVKNPRTGRLVLDVAGRIAGGGIILSLDAGTKRVRAAAPDREAIAVLASRLGETLALLHPRQRLERFCREVVGRVVFTTSFGLEDQAILHMLDDLSRQDPALEVDVVTLDTGRLFPETYDVWAETEQRYGRRIRAVYPQHASLEKLLGVSGINGFYASPESRSACCHVRKVEPLARVLAGAAGWVVGLRADQSDHRQDTALVLLDERGFLKLSPLLDWSRDAVEAFTRDNGVPVNRLHARGFASIGCAPCTRAISPGEPERVGRWWWEQNGRRECGLHSEGGINGAAQAALHAARSDVGN